MITKAERKGDEMTDLERKMVEDRKMLDLETKQVMCSRRQELVDSSPEYIESVFNVLFPESYDAEEYRQIYQWIAMHKSR
jgi:hypothetical protein